MATPRRRPWYQVSTPEQKRELEAQNWRRQIEAELFRGAHTEGTETASEMIRRTMKLFGRNPLGPKVDEPVKEDPLGGAPAEVQFAADRERAGLPAPGSPPRPGVARGVAEAFPEEAVGRKVYDSTATDPVDVIKRVAGGIDTPLASPENVPGPARMLIEELTRPSNALLATKGPAALARTVPKVGGVAARILEPSAGGFARRLITEAGASAGARGAAEEVNERLPEDTPKPVGIAAQLVAGLAGGTAGGVGAGAGLRTAERGATTYRDITKDIPVGASVKDVSGGLPEDLAGGAEPSFVDALDQLKSAVRTETRLRNSGVVGEEIRQGRGAQFGSVRQALDKGIESGLSGEALARQGRAGASAPGGLRRTVAEPVQLSQAQRDALFDEVMTRVADPGQDAALYLSTTRALQKALDGEGLQPAEIRALQPLLGNDMATALAGRAPEVAKSPVRDTRTGRPGSGPQLPGTPNVPTTRPGRKPNDLMVDPRAEERRSASIRQEAKSREAQALRQNGPTEDALMQKVDDLLATETRELDLPGRPTVKAKKAEVGETIKVWLAGNRDILDNMGPEGNQLIANINAQITGDVADSYVSAALSRRNILAESLRETWGEMPDTLKATERDKIIDKVTTALFERELKIRYGNAVPERVRDLLKTARPLPYDESLGALSTFTQRAKNSMFGIADVSVFGVQGLNAIRRGGIPMFAGLINRGLAAMHMPNVGTTYADIALPKQIQYGLDGVKQGATTGVFQRRQGQKEIGSIFQYLGKPGRLVDRPYMAAADKMSQWQFGTVLGGLRNLAYEGDLVLLKATGRDITKPNVRRQAAANANMIGSFAESALRKSRAQKEGVTFLSAPMFRSRVAHITQMANLLGPKASVAERTLAATTIMSTVGVTLALGKFLNDYIGVGEFEFDPSKPGFGQITTAGGMVIDVIPQDSVERAFAASIRALSESDPEMAAEAWGKMFIGSAGPIAKSALASVDVGYAPGSGYHFGDLPGNQAVNLAPIPPMARALKEGGASLGSALEGVGVPNFPESAIAETSRLFKDQSGGEFSDATTGQKREFYGQNPELTARLDEETLAQAKSGNRDAQARAVGIETRERLAELAAASPSLADYREKSRDIMLEQRGKLNAYDDVISGWGESENAVERLTAEYYSLFDQAKGPGGLIDYDKFDKLESDFAARTGSQYQEVQANIGTIDPRDNPMQQELDRTRNGLTGSGFFELRDNSWEMMRSRMKGRIAEEAGQFEDFYAYRDELAGQLVERLTERGIDPAIAERRAEIMVDSHAAVSNFEKRLRAERMKWAKANPELAQAAIKAGFLSASELNLKASGAIPRRTP